MEPKISSIRPRDRILLGEIEDTSNVPRNQQERGAMQGVVGGLLVCSGTKGIGILTCGFVPCLVGCGG